MLDVKACTMSVCQDNSYKAGKNTLQLAAEYSKSVELLKNLPQIDQSMAEDDDDITDDQLWNSSVCFLCKRFHFPSFNEMLECLLAANSSIVVVGDGFLSCAKEYGRSNRPDGKFVLTLMESLIEANLKFINDSDVYGDNTNILHYLAEYLEGESGVAIVSLLNTKYSDEVAVLLRC
jgi:hypothetical protein